MTASFQDHADRAYIEGEPKPDLLGRAFPTTLFDVRFSRVVRLVEAAKKSAIVADLPTAYTEVQQQLSMLTPIAGGKTGGRQAWSRPMVRCRGMQCWARAAAACLRRKGLSGKLHKAIAAVDKAMADFKKALDWHKWTHQSMEKRRTRSTSCSRSSQLLKTQVQISRGDSESDAIFMFPSSSSCPGLVQHPPLPRVQHPHDTVEEALS